MAEHEHLNAPLDDAAGTKVQRSFAIEIDAAIERAADDDRIPVCISSEEPLEGPYGLEILDHGAGLDLTRASRGLPLLVANHTTGEQVGIVENPSVGPDRRLRGLARFSKGPRGQEIRRDVEEGIRQNISVGGIRLGVMGREKVGKESVIRMRWQPTEATLVAVPLDVTVGVRRSADEAASVPMVPSSEPAPKAKESSMSENAAATGAAPSTTTGAITRAEVEVTVRGHATEIIRMCRENKLADKAEGFIERGLSPEAVAVEILRAQRATPAEPVAAPVVARVHEPEKFKTLGEQLGAVVRAGMPGGGVDQRLVGRAASGSSEGSPSDGGFLIQPEFATEIMSKAYGMGDVLSRVRKIPIGPGANGLKINAIDETSRANGSRWGGVQTYWVAEADTATAKKPKFRQIELNLKKLMGLHYATDELLADATALEAVSGQAFAEEISFAVEDTVFNGSGAGQPLGILNSGALVTQAAEGSQTATTVNTANIVKMYARMYARSRSNAVWFINQDVEPLLMQLTLLAGTSSPGIYLPAGSIAGSPFSTLLGRPVVPVEYCATLGTVGDVIFADLSQYLMIDKGGPEAAQSMHVRFLYDEMVFRYTYRVDGQPAWNSALTPKNGSNTLSPFVALAAR